MGIDGIGKKGPPAARPRRRDAKGPRAHREAGSTFEVPRLAGSAPLRRRAPVDATRTALERLRAGEIDVNGYVDAKVQEATAHLGALPPAALRARFAPPCATAWRAIRLSPICCARRRETSPRRRATTEARRGRSASVSDGAGCGRGARLLAERARRRAGLLASRTSHRRPANVHVLEWDLGVQPWGPARAR